MRYFFVALFVAIFIAGCGAQNQEKVEKPAETATESTLAVANESVSTPEPVVAPAPAREKAATQPKKPEPAPEPPRGSESEKSELPKLWDFFATWCPPCKKQAPIIEELAAEYKGQIEIASIDTDKNQELARKFNIQAIPTLVFLDASGKEVSRHVGFFPKDSIIARFRTHGFIK